MKWWLGLAVGGIAILATLSVRLDLPVEELKEYSGEPSEFADIQGLKVHYRDEGVAGTAPPLVLLHGTSASLHTWDGWVAELARDHRIVRMDLPGFGLTGPDPGHRYAPEDDVAFLDAFFDELKLERVALAGNSLGGGIALHYALEHPQRVSRLILIDSSGLPHDKIWSLELLALPGIGRIFRWTTPRSGTRRMLEQVYADDSKVTEDLVDRYYELLLREGNRAALRARWRIPRPSLADRLHEIDTPTLVLWGAKDEWLPADPIACQFRDGIAGAELEIYPDLGHVPMEEGPVQTALRARAFLAG